MLVTADRVIHEGYAYPDLGVQIDTDGRIQAIDRLAALGRPTHVLEGRVLLPGFVNVHSHAFQRLLRGHTQFVGPAGDNFWTWRDTMYRVAHRLDPHGFYVATRHVFLEMLLAGVTTVGEFHYVHHRPDGAPYDNTHELADAVVQAARDVGIRLSLIRVVYLRGDFDTPPSDAQKRFCDPSLDVACDRFDALVGRLIAMGDPRLSWAVAAHSVRGVSKTALVGLKVRLGHMPFHIHISEQKREVDSCRSAHGLSPVALLADSQVLDSCTTLVHATHLEPGEAQAIANTGTVVCMCPSTEADLGDGLGPASDLFRLRVPLCLGTDGQTSTSVLAEARRLEMHERLRLQQRNVLGRGEGDSVATRLLEMATQTGAAALGVETGALRPGKWADLTAFDLTDPALAGADGWSLLPAIVFSADSRAVRDVMVGGQLVVRDGTHALTRASCVEYARLCEDLFDSQRPRKAPDRD